MSNEFEQFMNLPDISIIENITLEGLQAEMEGLYISKYKEITGEAVILQPASFEKIIINAIATKLFQAYKRIDDGFKMNSLKYARGKYLQHLGAFKGVFLEDAKPATVTVRFLLEEERKSVTPIPGGKKVTAGDNIFFATKEYGEIGAGKMYTDVLCECTTKGKVGNEYPVGTINMLADSIPYISRVANIDKPSGGCDVETDNEFRETIFLHPSQFSTAGTEDSYIYFVQKYSSEITAIYPYVKEDSTVHICIMLEGGKVPDEIYCKNVRDYILETKKEALTDKLIVEAPEVVNYEIDITYYVAKSNVGKLEIIEKSVDDSINSIIELQEKTIGMDIVPDSFISSLRAAGVKRCVVTEPGYTVIHQNQIAVHTGINLTFGGIEDD